ncbi:MAG: GlsB/YeaQ/YmgE family stress response membrane protein [Trebonia sp.]
MLHALGWIGTLDGVVLFVVVLIALLVILAVAGWAVWLIVSAAIVGGIIGGVARLLIPGRQPIGILSTIVLGWIGSLGGSLLGRHVFHVGAILTVLCEIGVAVILVGLASGRAGSSVARRNASLRW